MMEQYRLKKWYPSLPEGMKVGDTVERFNGRSYHPFQNPNKNAIYSKEVEDNPEFWEPVKEKDYEILKLRPNSKHPNYRIGSMPSHIYPYDDRLSTKYFDIYSVKRLSDGEVFTVGDRVHEAGSLYSAEITKFDLFKDIVRVYFGAKWCILQTVVHTKEPLFITKDGKEIFEGDKFCVINSDYNNIYNRVGGDGLHYEQEQVRKRCFSTREKAEEWIEENKPQYSKKDIEEAMVWVFRDQSIKKVYTKLLFKYLK